MHIAEHDHKAIMYPAYGTHRLRTIIGNEIQLSHSQSEWQQWQKPESFQTFLPNPAYKYGAGY